MNIRQKGFTLVELLIVMVVIAVLSVAMLLSSTEVTASSNVAKVLSDLKMMEKAILMCCADNYDKYPNPPYCNPPTMAEVRMYLDNPSIINNNGKETNDNSTQWNILRQHSGNNPPIWYLYYKMPTHMTDSYSFRRKMQARAKSMTLFWSKEPNVADAVKAGRFYEAQKVAGRNSSPVEVYMPISM